MNSKEPRCSFCNKGRNAVNKLIANNSTLICDECVRLCYQILNMEVLSDGGSMPESLTPRSVYEFLEEHIIGQDRAKRVMAVAIYNHYKRIMKSISSISREGRKKSEWEEVEIAKSNILLLGPTGCGKTLFAQTLARILKVPLVIVDATGLTETGYVGDDVSDILVRLLNAAGGNLEQASKGIVYLDEVDKIACKVSNGSFSRDVSGEGVQQGLLKLMEGTVANVSLQGGRRHPAQETIQFNTSDVLFICGGAFEGLSKIIEARINKPSMGFGANVTAGNSSDVSEVLRKVEAEDMVKYGLIPEFVGRLPVIATLDSLTKDDLIAVMTKPKNAVVKQYQALLHMDGVELEMTPEALEMIATQAIAKKTGARALRTIVENLLLDTMFDIPDSKDIAKVVINGDTVSTAQKPTLVYGRKARAKKVPSRKKTAKRSKVSV